MTDEHSHPALARILREHGAGDVLTLLGERLSGADLTTLLLEVMRRRAASLTPAQVLAQYTRDRFVRPASVDPRRLLELEMLVLDAVSPPFDIVATSPLAPLGAHSVVAGVHQHRVVTTLRGSEVAADPTNSLALEAAVRRRSLLAADSRSAELVRLACVDRVVRAQQFGGPRSFAHFSLLGLVSAGRDTGGRTFERLALAEHVRALCTLCERFGFEQTTVRLTDFAGTHGEVVRRLVEELRADGVTVAEWPDREAGRDYYPSVCFQLAVAHDGEQVDIADGGVVGWTQALLGNDKERLMISGLGLERLSLIAVRS